MTFISSIVFFNQAVHFDVEYKTTNVYSFALKLLKSNEVVAKVHFKQQNSTGV